MSSTLDLHIATLIQKLPLKLFESVDLAAMTVR